MAENAISRRSLFAIIASLPILARLREHDTAIPLSRMDKIQLCRWAEKQPPHLLSAWGFGDQSNIAEVRNLLELS